MKHLGSSGPAARSLCHPPAVPAGGLCRCRRRPTPSSMQTGVDSAVLFVGARLSGRQTRWCHGVRVALRSPPKAPLPAPKEACWSGGGPLRAVRPARLSTSVDADVRAGVGSGPGLKPRHANAGFPSPGVPACSAGCVVEMWWASLSRCSARRSYTPYLLVRQRKPHASPLTRSDPWLSLSH